MSSFGHASRMPPPAKPQPTAKNGAPHSPAASAGSGSTADDGAGVGTGDQAGEERAFERQVGGVVVEQHARGDARGERDGEAQREHQPVGPVAPLEDQDVAEAAIAGQHRRQRGHDGQLADQGRQQELSAERNLGS